MYEGDNGPNGREFWYAARRVVYACVWHTADVVYVRGAGVFTLGVRGHFGGYRLFFRGEIDTF